MVQTHVAKITSVEIPMEPEVFLLDAWNMGGPEGTTHALILILLAAARLAISSLWKTPGSISIIIWFDKSWDQFVMAKISDKVEGCMQNETYSRSEQMWSPHI